MARPRKVQTPGQIAAETETVETPVETIPEPVPVARTREGEPKWQLTENGWDLV